MLLRPRPGHPFDFSWIRDVQGLDFEGPGGPRPVPGLSNGHGYDVMNCIILFIVMTSCEYQNFLMLAFLMTNVTGI